jgi:uncharacterized protein YabN with tetrapyrrole methylase and pyrophosphatase domain
VILLNNTDRLFKELAELLQTIKQKCPESRSNDLNFYKKDLVDEAMEARMAVDKQDWQELKEELGDVLWSWLDFCIQAEKQGLFTTQDVLELLKHKLQQRNPHVFGKQKASTIEEAKAAKKKAKQEWKEGKSKTGF